MKTPEDHALEWVNDLSVDNEDIEFEVKETIRQSLSARQWMPIESAPQYIDIITISPIRLGDGFYEPEVMHRNDQTWYRKDSTRSFATPTHWMPLPDAPPSGGEGKI